jgi:hypothetical protein
LYPNTRTLLSLVVLTIAIPVAANGLESSDACGGCHVTIHESWKASAHSTALTNDVFQKALRETRSKRGDLAGLCLECHAPLAALTGDHKLEYRLTWEGVNCEVCHSMVSVELSGTGPRRVLDTGPAKRGPVKEASSDAHEVAYSELHLDSLACAWCHEYTNPEGTPVLTTYTEWQTSSAASEGTTCQRCHMGATRTEVDDPRVEREPGAEINLHEVPGGHSLDQLHRSLGLSIDSSREGDRLLLRLGIRNKGAGHAVPTGMPGRRVVMDVAVRTSDGASFEEQRVYGKFFVTADGTPVTRDMDYFSPGVELGRDSRIRPDERRVEELGFDVGAEATAYVTVKLRYIHSPLGTEEGRTDLTFLSEKRVLRP